MERFAVIGLGLFGRRLATLLSQAGAEVIAVDNDRGLVESVRDDVTLAVCLDCTDAEALKAQGIDKVDVAVVGMGANLEASALTTVILKQIGVSRIIARATTSIRAQILSRIGADGIVNPEHESAERWRDKLLAPAMLERIVLGEEHSLVQVEAPRSFHGKTLGELDVHNAYDVLVVAIRRTVERTDARGKTVSKEQVIAGPGPNDTVQPGDVLTIIGRDEAIAKFPT
ncbi:MAG: TrkA family potassium uptake protein [Phycisphaerae bacterium]|nr:TrkA family potassium uptake protein [Phycisphaerae bacterium]